MKSFKNHNAGSGLPAISEWLLLLLIILAVIAFFVGCAATGTDPGALFSTLAGWFLIAIVIAGAVALVVWVLALLFGRRR